MGIYQNRIVVKAGTSTLTNEIGKSDLRAFDRLACVIADIQNKGYEVILVSSGAIAVGTNKLNIKAKPSNMRMKQAADLATSNGADTIITNGKRPEALYKIITGKSVGTIFTGKVKK